MHPSASRRNVARTLHRAVVALDLGGAEVYPDGDDRTPDLDARVWVRLTLLDVAQRYAGRIGGAHATRVTYHLSAEVWARDAAADLATVDQVDQLAEVIADSFRYRSLPLLDCTGNPDAPPEVAGFSLRGLEPPLTQRLDPLDGFRRRLVICPFTLFSLSNPRS